MKKPRTSPDPLSYQYFWRAMGFFAVCLGVGIWALITGFTHHPQRWPIMAPLGAALVVGSPFVLVGAIRILRIIRADRAQGGDDRR